MNVHESIPLEEMNSGPLLKICSQKSFKNIFKFIPKSEDLAQSTRTTITS